MYRPNSNDVRNSLSCCVNILCGLIFMDAIAARRDFAQTPSKSIAKLTRILLNLGVAGIAIGYSTPPFFNALA